MASPAPAIQPIATRKHQLNRLTEPHLSTLHAHAIFVLAGRSTDLTPDHLPFIEGELCAVCAANQAELLKSQVIEDQLHLLIEYSPAIKLADLLEMLQASLTDWSWNRKIFVGSCRRPDLTHQMRQYLQSVRSVRAC